ncbi:MAG: DUF1214 domain-containing protein, partial [Pseudomonas veronii]|nr:DUF1214 domain-containing protein [Pseudomonas veronii]
MSDRPATVWLPELHARPSPRLRTARRSSSARFASIGIAPGAPFKVNQLSCPSSAKRWKTGSPTPRLSSRRSKKTRLDHPAGRHRRPVRQPRSPEEQRPVPLCRRRGWGCSATQPTKPRRYFTYVDDSEGKPANGARHSYTVHFAKDQLPPADAFWSLTL